MLFPHRAHYKSNSRNHLDQTVAWAQHCSLRFCHLLFSARRRLHCVSSYFSRDNSPDLSLTLGASLPIVRHSAFITIFPDIALLCRNPITDKLKYDLYTHIWNQHFIIVLAILHFANMEFKTIVKLRANTEL